MKKEDYGICFSSIYCTWNGKYQRRRAGGNEYSYGKGKSDIGCKYCVKDTKGNLRLEINESVDLTIDMDVDLNLTGISNYYRYIPIFRLL